MRTSVAQKEKPHATNALEQKGAGEPIFHAKAPRDAEPCRSARLLQRAAGEEMRAALAHALPAARVGSEGRPTSGRACADSFARLGARVGREGRSISGPACAGCGAAGGSRKRRAHSSLRLRSACGLPSAERLDVGRVRRPWRWRGQEDGGRPRRGIVRRRRLLPGPGGRGETSGGARGRGARRRLDGEHGRAWGGAGEGSAVPSAIFRPRPRSGVGGRAGGNGGTRPRLPVGFGLRRAAGSAPLLCVAARGQPGARVRLRSESSCSSLGLRGAGRAPLGGGALRGSAGQCGALRAGTATCSRRLPALGGGCDSGDFSVKISSDDLLKCLFFFFAGGNSLNLVKVGIVSPLLTLSCFFMIR